MKQKLPKVTVETVVLFPKNFRLITEHTFSEKQSHNIKVVIVSVFSLFLLAFIALQSITIRDNFLLRESFSQEHAQLQNEVTYWKDLADKYKGDRDIDYRIAALQYKLGNISESQKYVKQALELDPNFPEGRVLGAQVGL
jgi:tetratricopeptide (TPR) repeat protein